MSRRGWAASLFVAVLSGLTSGAAGQEVTAADYSRAEQFLPGNVVRHITGLPRLPVSWIQESDRFWYQVRTDQGKRFIFVDPEARVRREAFDHDRLASALSTAADTAYESSNLPFETFRFSNDLRAIDFDVATQAWRCSIQDYSCATRDTSLEPGKGDLPSPNRDRAVYRSGSDLWIKALGDSVGRPLTSDGAPYFDYAASPEGNTSSVSARRFGLIQPPVALWSPDGRYVVTHQLDQREVLDMHLVQGAPEDGSKRPRHFSYKYAHPGDSIVPTAALVVVDTRTLTERDTQMDTPEDGVLHLEADPIIAILESPISFQEVWWSNDSAALYFLRFARGRKSVSLESADARTGQVRRILDESCATYCELHPSIGARPNVRVLDSGEILWWSERSGWGHLYLYDGETGSLTRQVTEGPWLVQDVLHVDERARTVLFTASGRESGDPYYRSIYRASLDGGPVTRLTVEDADHLASASPTGRFLFDVYGQIDSEPTTVLRNQRGDVILELEQASVENLRAQGWTPPEQIVTKARDGLTDLYGLVVKPTGFDPEFRYPVIEYVYPGPQTHWVPKSLADPLAGRLWDAQATAELGAVVVLLDGMGTPGRSKGFHDVSYGNLEDAGGLSDHISGLKQLAAARPYMDLDRVGVYGFSGGGYMSTHAILTEPDFYKVAVSGAGNHDQRGYIGLWGEKYHGLMEADGTNYIQQANVTHAAQLEGRLLLIHGEMDDNVSPALTMQLVDALIKANRQFDMLILPNLNHGAGSDPYYIRRKWDYFVEHLIGSEPPKNYRVVPS